MICNNIHIFRLFSFLSQKFYPVTISLCSLFSIPEKYFTLFPLYLNSLNETVSKSLLMTSICIGLTNRSNSLRISLICSNGTVTMFPATNKLRKMLSNSLRFILLYIFVKLTIQAVQVYNI